MDRTASPALPEDRQRAQPPLEYIGQYPGKHMPMNPTVLWIWMAFYFPAIAYADRAFRCQGRLVYIGEPKSNVLSACGEPDHIDMWQKNPDGYTSKIFEYEKERYQLPELIEGPIFFERWTYNLGPNQFRRFLFFQNGALYKIERGEK
jgi:hypothetical protein